MELIEICEKKALSHIDSLTICEKIPHCLYHYTSMRNFLGIVESKSIWLTDHYFLNDPHDGFLIHKVARELILSEFSADSPQFLQDVADVTHKVTQIMKDSQDPYDIDLLDFEVFRIGFVFSLSEKEDLLSQWQAYGDKGRGISVGFELNNHKNSFYTSDDTIGFQKQYRATLIKVLYDENKQKDIIRFIMNLNIETYQKCIELVKINEHAKQEVEKLIRFSVLKSLQHLRLRVKSPSFQEEGEWRIVVNLDRLPNKIEVRVRDEVMIPYIRLPISGVRQKDGPIHINRLMFGPDTDYLRCSRAVRSLGMFRWEGPQCRKSSFELR